MEKTLSVEEKLRKAEEIYQRRRLQGNRISSNTINIGNKPDLSLFKKTLIKLLFCVILYFLLYFVKNSNYFFSKDVINKINDILAYDINLQGIYSEASKYLENLSKSFHNFNYIESNGESNEKDDKNMEENKEKDKIESNKTNVEYEENKTDSMEDSKDNNSEKEINNIEDEKENNKESQNEYLEIGEKSEIVDDSENDVAKDVKYIKDNFKLEIPVNGVITSKFGTRTPSSIISENHSGIDIGAVEGTKIKTAIQGIVTKVSSFGDYRKSFRNKK